MRQPNLELITSWLLPALGRNLLSANALFHVFASKKGMAQEISLLFEDYEPGKFYGCSDGESLCFSLAPLVECDLGEYGQMTIGCVSDEACFSNVVGKKLASASFVRNSMNRITLGVVLSFDMGFSLSILHLGDEIFVYNDIPLELIVSEKLNFILVAK
jgi:hypothetical protein